jgi:hypothetical protein
VGDVLIAMGTVSAMDSLESRFDAPAGRVAPTA